MSGKERVRMELLGRVKRKEMTVARAAGLAGLSVRQMRRLWKRYRRRGAAGLVHGLRGRASNRRIDDAGRERIVGVYREKYPDFGPTFACQKLAAVDGIRVSPDTLTSLLKEQGLWQPRRKRSRHRRRRERRACFGELLQLDGSEHDWFEGRGERCVLMVAVDDATSRTDARFFARETLAAALEMFRRWSATHGLPRALYVDRAGIYRGEDRDGKPTRTQFGRAMDQLQVELILANSPQAKGRVERRNGLLQDRLVKEMRLAGISSIEAANLFLDQTFLKELNDAYTHPAADGTVVHRKPDPGLRLEEVLCEHEERVVGNDWCVRWNNAFVQIDPKHESLALAGKRVLVKALADGTLVVEHRGRPLTHRPIGRRPQEAAPRPKARPVIKNNKQWKPANTHPWNRPAPLRKVG
jgi:transposase